MSHFILKDKPAAHPQPDTARPAAAGSSISLAPADGKTCGATYPRAVATGLVIAVCLPPDVSRLGVNARLIPCTIA